MSIYSPNPCIRATALRDLITRISAGEAEGKVRVRAADGEREVIYQKPDLVRLEALRRDAEAECAAASGASMPRRFAIAAGSRRRSF